MERVIKWWNGYILVELSGSSSERLINLCGYNGIELWDLICFGDRYRFYVRRRDFKQLIEFVRKSKTRLIVLQKQGFPFQVSGYRKRKWFAAGVLVCLGILYVFSLHIWSIDFDGNSYFTDELLQKTLQNEGYTTRMRKSHIVCEDLEMMLREIYPEITWVSAQINGTKLHIQLRENTGILTVNEEEITPCHLISPCDGIITEMITRKGTPLVKAGDMITDGQPLVSGIVSLYNDNKEKVGEHLVAADADIFVQSQLNYENKIRLEYQKKWYTGLQRYRLQITVWKHIITLDFTGRTTEEEKEENVIIEEDDKDQKHTFSLILNKLLNKIPSLKKISFLYRFETYDSVTTTGKLQLGSRWDLPIQWQLTTLREYEETTAIHSKDKAYSLAEENCARFFEKLLEKGVQIIEKNVRIDMMGNECVAIGTVTVIQSIGQKIPITENLDVQEETSN